MSDMLLHIYKAAKTQVITLGYEPEIHWTSELQRRPYTEADMLREAAWVILCSGFREGVVRRKFSYLSLCFCDWESAEIIAQQADQCIGAALHSFGNRRKLEAIVSVAQEVAAEGFDKIRIEVDENPLIRLRSFPFIGPVTAQHLAKNLGYAYAKDDRHLVRIADDLGFPDAQSLCAEISSISGDSIPEVDTVLWRLGALGGKLSTLPSR